MDRKRNQFACQVQKIRESIDAGKLVFQDGLSIKLIEEAISRYVAEFRDRVYTPWTTLWLFLNQVISRSSCQRAVSRFIAYRAAHGQSPCSPKTTAYCGGRQRLPIEFYQFLMEESGRRTAAKALESWKFHGREVKPVDGTTVSMPETEDNVEAYPLQDKSRAGISFPLARLLVVFSLSVGTVLKVARAPYRGKGTGEYSLLREVLSVFNQGDIALGDCGFCSFSHLAELHQRGVDSVVKLEGTRLGNFILVKRLGKNDAHYRWTKPKSQPETFSSEEFKSLPAELLVRIITVYVRQRGFRTQRFDIVTTLTDHQEYPAEELALLYRRRWWAELYLRDIKSTLEMDHLSCKTPEMVEKEIYVHLLAYNMIRIQMAEAAQLADLPPYKISFKSTLETIIEFQSCQQPTTNTMQATMYATIAFHQVGKQPNRNQPRAVKRREKHELLTKPRSEYQNQAA